MMTALKSILACTALSVYLVTMAGCASPSRSQTSGVIISGKPVSTAIVYVTIGTSLTGLDHEKLRLREALLSSLNESKMFETVVQNWAGTNLGNGIKISAEINRLKKVSAEARAWNGALAGRASATVRTTITDLKSGRPIEEFEVVGESGKSAFAGTTDEAISRVADQIVTEVLKLNAQTSE